ncbi:hypothetical protein [Rhodovulum sulfidophilum]|uniref:hypothetical protein n=1 Tax=Rhodovulum sulfidophilum TaxID=35806 RepID=UPI0019222970|nr:hypothetical protein [Rhodovulum sulfidophilum]MBL3560153.1 hypothetical protein [Rhodovulum sulfidophilum]
MNRRTILVATALLVFTGIAAMLGQQAGQEIEASACNTAELGLSGDAPLELGAIFSRYCARLYVEETPDEAPRLIITLGYPSLLFDYLTEREALQVISGAMNDGDRGFFAQDSEILARLNALSRSPEIEKIEAFLQFLPPGDAPSQSPDSAWRLSVLPIWDDAKTAALFVQGCETVDCQASRTSCPGEVGLIDKLKLAQGDARLSDVAALCPISHEWILALRRAGIVDTFCTSTLQVNAAMNDIETLERGCFPEDMQLMSYDALTPNDAVMFLRERFARQALAEIDMPSLDYVANYFPSAAAYLLRGEIAE